MGATVIKIKDLKRPHGIDEEDYHVFRSKDSDAKRKLHRFSEDNEELKSVNQWFQDNSNLDGWLGSLSDEERRSIDNLVGGQLMDPDAYLPWKEIPESMKRTILGVASALDRSEHANPFIVHRASHWRLMNEDGSNTPLTVEQINEMASRGYVVRTKGHMSTSAAESGLHIDGLQPVEYRIHYPGGKASKGAGMFISSPEAKIKGFTKHRGIGFEREREFVGNKGSAFQVGGAHYDPIRMMTVVDLYYIGLDKSARFK